MNLDEYARMFAAEDTHWWYVGMRDTTLGLLNGHLEPGGRLSPLGDLASLPVSPLEAAQAGKPAPLRILDAGCGTGGLLTHLAQRGQAVGIDLSPLGLSFARQRGLPSLSQASVERLPFADAAFDLITCMDVLYHLQVHEDVAALREFHRVLRPGGYLLVKVPAFEALRGRHDQTVHTRHRYTLAELRVKLQITGFRVERATYANTLLLPLAAAKRLLEHVLPLASEGESDVQMPAPWLNRLLTGVMQVEARLVRQVDLPIGVSAIALARRDPL